MSVSILLAAFNGGEYIEKQIDSILNQTYRDWKLFIRDDGSSDNTRIIIQRYVSMDSRIIAVDKDNGNNIGVVKSFFKLLNIANSKYYMFCDQDDIWLKDKVKVTVERAQRFDQSIPLLVHTNLTTFSDEHGVINQRLYGNSNIDKLNVMLSSNSVAGCTILINNELKNKVINDSSYDVVMHDWWLALCANSFGKVSYIETSTIMYRIHDNNQVGTDTSKLKKLRRLFNYSHEIERQANAVEQGKMIYLLHSDQMHKKEKKIFSKFINLQDETFVYRILNIQHYNFKKNSFLGDMSLFNIYLFNNERLKKMIFHNVRKKDKLY